MHRIESIDGIGDTDTGTRSSDIMEFDATFKQEDCESK